MKKTIRLLSIVMLVTVICLSTITLAFASANIPAATNDFYVNDFAGVFTAEEKSRLMANAVTLADETDGIQVVVTTIKSLEGDTIENYALNMYNEYGIGKDDMGLLILLATENRQIRVEVGRAMEAYINDAKAGRFMDKYAIPYLSENKFNEGLLCLQEAFISEIKSCVGSETNSSTNNSSQINIDFGAVFGVLGAIALVVLGGVFVVYIVNKIRKKAKEKKEYIDGLNQQIASLENAAEMLRDENSRLKRNNEEVKLELTRTRETLETLQSKQQRILKIYPDVERKVADMIQQEIIAKDKEAARRVDNLISSVINLKPDKSLVSRLRSVMSEYSSLSHSQQEYIESDIQKLNKLYYASFELKKEYDDKVERERIRRLTEERKQTAANVTSQILGVIALVGVARANDLSRLRQAKNLYDNLDRETRGYVDDSAISKLESLLRAAKRDKDEQEEEERRRRAMRNSTISHSSSSSSFNHRSHSGFGGRSGGGGSSRKF